MGVFPDYEAIGVRGEDPAESPGGQGLGGGSGRWRGGGADHDLEADLGDNHEAKEHAQAAVEQLALGRGRYPELELGLVNGAAPAQPHPQWF